MPVALVTGTSSGIGLATSVALARAGYRTWATMRNLAKAGPLREAAAGLPLEIAELDVADPASVARAMARLAQRDGGVDVLVNNAGIGGASPLELVPEDEHRAIFEVNYWGPIRMIQAVLTGMRERGSGRIVNVSSGAGRFCAPNQVPYTASKHALEAACETLAHEVVRFGVFVSIIEPGVVDTAIFENSVPMTRFDRDSPYRDLMRRSGKVYKAGLKTPSRPEAVAEKILEAIGAKAPMLRYVVGDDARKLIEGRQSISDEEYVALGGDLSDEEYAERYERIFATRLE